MLDKTLITLLQKPKTLIDLTQTTKDIRTSSPLNILPQNLPKTIDNRTGCRTIDVVIISNCVSFQYNLRIISAQTDAV